MSARFEPPRGTPPSLEWVAVDRLQVDARYQRNLEARGSSDLILSIARGWDWQLCLPLIVARRADGGLFVVDGQHRLRAAHKRGDIAHLPCVIAAAGALSDEARVFVSLNARRRPLDRLALFRGALAAGDAGAEAIAGAVAAAGLAIAPHSNPTAWQPGQICNVGGLERIHKRHGAALLGRALVALAEAFPGQVLRYAGTLLPGIAEVYRKRIDAPEFDPDLFIAVLAGQGQADWYNQIRSFAAENGLDGRTACGKLIEAAYSEAAAAADA